jgi:hypothetical protein
VSQAFYLPTDERDRFVATAHTQGPWDAGLQHAGPPSGLIVRAIEQVAPSVSGPAQVARLTVEILGAVPVGELRVRAALARRGRSVELVEAELLAGDQPVMRARAWRIRRAPVGLPPDVLSAPEPAPRRAAEASGFTDPVWRAGYLRAIEWRFAEGHFEAPGPAVVWARQRVPLVAGEDPTPLQRLVVLADSGNGLSRQLDPQGWWFINIELTVHLHRRPRGEWMCLAARTTLDDEGLGLAETVLFDDDGRVGRGAQALMVARRP